MLNLWRKMPLFSWRNEKKILNELITAMDFLRIQPTLQQIVHLSAFPCSTNRFLLDFYSDFRLFRLRPNWGAWNYQAMKYLMRSAYRVRELLWSRRTMIETYEWWKSNTTFSRVMIVFGAFCVNIWKKKVTRTFLRFYERNCFYFVRWSSDYGTAQTAPSRRTEKLISF